MYIDRHLNIVVEIERENYKVFVHSTPISREVFEVYYLPISKAFSKIYRERLDSLAGPRVAALLLKEAAIECGMWEGAQGAENGLLGEIVRLSNAILPNEQGGWHTIPLYNAFQQKLLSDQEKSEVMGILAFFTCVYQMHQKKNRQQALDGLQLWETHTSLLNVTEYMSSLTTSTVGESSGETSLPPLSLPY